MKEFMRILVEQTAIGLGQGDLMTWFYVTLFTLTSMKLANYVEPIRNGGLYHICLLFCSAYFTTCRYVTHRVKRSTVFIS